MAVSFGTFQFRNPTANQMTFFTEFVNFVSFNKLEEYQVSKERTIKKLYYEGLPKFCTWCGNIIEGNYKASIDIERRYQFFHNPECK